MICGDNLGEIMQSQKLRLFNNVWMLCCVVQATMVCMDNSEWMRNGDYSPTRFQAQADAVNLICGAKTQVLLQDSFDLG